MARRRCLNAGQWRRRCERSYGACPQALQKYTAFLCISKRIKDECDQGGEGEKVNSDRAGERWLWRDRENLVAQRLRVWFRSHSCFCVCVCVFLKFVSYTVLLLLLVCDFCYCRESRQELYLVGGLLWIWQECDGFALCAAIEVTANLPDQPGSVTRA